MYKRAILLKLAKMTKVQPPVFARLNPICRISAQNQGIDPTLLQYNPGRATDLLMQRFLQGKIKKYDPDKDPKWQEMIGKSAAMVGNNAMQLASLQNKLRDPKTMREIQQFMPQTGTGLWARNHNAANQQLMGPYHQAEEYNKLTHMTHNEDLMPGVGSRSLSLNTRQNIANPTPTYGSGRGAKSY